MANSQLSADLAVIFPELPDSTPPDYLRAIGTIIGSSQIHSFYNTDGLIKIYLKERIHVEKVCEKEIVVLGHHLRANDVEFSLLKITLSGVDPAIPDSYLEELLKSYGTLASPITHHKLFEDASFSHIDSGVRYVELKVFKAVIIPTTIQVRYRDILCAVALKVKKKSLLKKSTGVRSSRKNVDPEEEFSTDFDSSTPNDATGPKDSAFEFVSRSAETVKVNPRRSVKKVANCDESASVASCTFTPSANGGISRDHPPQQRLSISNAINICDLSLPKSAENRFKYLNEKQRLKSELISKNFFQLNACSSTSARRQHNFNTKNKRINLSRYPNIKSVKRNQTKSVISELLSIHGTEKHVTKKVNSCTVSNLCDIQKVCAPNPIALSRLTKKINDRFKIGNVPSNAGSVPKQTSTNTPIHQQKLSKISKEKSINKRVTLTPKASSSNSVHCSNNFNFEQDGTNPNIRHLRPRSKTNTVCVNTVSTNKSNESSDSLIILPDTNENSEYPNSSSIGLKVYDKTPSSVSYASHQNLPSCSKAFETSEQQKDAHVSAEDFSNNVYASSSSVAEQNYQYSNLNDKGNKRVSGAKFQKRGQSKKVENSNFSGSIPGNNVVHRPLLKAATTTATTIGQSHTSFDVLPQVSKSSKCLDWISDSNKSMLKEKRQAVLKYESQKRLLSSAKAIKTQKNRKSCTVSTPDEASNNVVSTLSTDKEKSQDSKSSANSIHIEETSPVAKSSTQEKRSQRKFKNVTTNINHLQQETLPSSTQNTVGNELPNLLFDNQKSQYAGSRTSTRLQVLDKKPATDHQSHSEGSSTRRRRETWNSISAAAKNITGLDDVSSLPPKRKRPRNSDLKASPNKEELNGVESQCGAQATSSPSDPVPEVTSTTLNSTPNKELNGVESQCSAQATGSLSNPVPEVTSTILNSTPNKEELNGVESQCSAQATSSPSNPVPEVTSTTLNSTPTSIEVQHISSSIEEKSDQAFNSASDKSNDFNDVSSDIQCENQQNILLTNQKMGESLDSLLIVSNATDSEEGPNLSSSEKECPNTYINDACINSSKDFDKVPFDTQSSNFENLPLPKLNNEIVLNSNSISMSDCVQDVTSCDASSISQSKPKSSQIVDQNNEKSNGNTYINDGCINSSKDFDKVPSDTQSSNFEKLPLPKLNNEIVLNSNSISMSDCVQDATSCDASSISQSKPNTSQVVDQNNEKSNGIAKIQSETQCKNQQSNSQSKHTEDKTKVSLDSQPKLPLDVMCSDRQNLVLNKEDNDVPSISSSQDFDNLALDIHTIKQPEISQPSPKNEKINHGTHLNLQADLPLDIATCDADTLSKNDSLDLNTTSSNNISKDIDQSGSVNREKILQCSTAAELNITYDSAPVLSHYTEDPTICLSNEDIPLCTDEFINETSMDFANKQLDTLSSLEKMLPSPCSILDKTEEICNPFKHNPLSIPYVEYNLNSLNLTTTTVTESKDTVQLKNSSNYKSTIKSLQNKDFKKSLSQIHAKKVQCMEGANKPLVPIVTESIKPPKIGVCLPIPQCPTPSLHFNQNLTYKYCINPQEIAKFNTEKDKTNAVFSRNAQITSSIAAPNKECKVPNLTTGVSNKSEMYVKQCYSNSQSKSLQKRSEYGIRSIFYNSKTNNSGNRNKNKKVGRKRKIKSKDKTVKKNVASSRNSGQNKGCFSEYEFNSSDSDSKDISYSKWRSQKQTPKKRFRSSSLDNVNSTVFPSSVANNSTNMVPYDLSMKSRKLNPTIVNTARYDHNTLIRKKQRLDAICRRVSLINKANPSNKTPETCEKEKTVLNNSNYILSVPTFAVNKTDERQRNIDCHSKVLTVSNGKFIPEVLSSYVLPLSIPHVESSLNSSNLTTTTVIEIDTDAISHSHQLLESKDSVQLKNSSNYKSTIKSLQNKDFKKSLSQIHAKKVRKRMKKNTVRYMCLQNDGKKIVLKKVSAFSDCNKSPIDLTNQSSEAASSASNELETNIEDNPVGIAAIAQENSIVSTENIDFNSCVNGFLEQLSNSNPQTIDAGNHSDTHVKENKSLSLMNKTLVECGVDNDLQLQDSFQLHMETTTNESIDLAEKNVSIHQSTVCSNSSNEDLKPNIGTSCSSSDSNLVFLEQAKLVKEVELSQSQVMDEPNEIFLNGNVTDESNCPDEVIIKLESADPKEYIEDMIEVVEDPQRSMTTDVPHSNVPLADVLTSVDNAACVSTNDQDDAISSIKITEVYGSVTYCNQTEKVNGSAILIIPGGHNLINNTAYDPGCINDSLNQNEMLTSGINVNNLSSTSECINSDSFIQRIHSDAPLIENLKSLEETNFTPELLFTQNQSDNRTCAEEIVYEQKVIDPEIDVNQNTVGGNLAENEMGSNLMKGKEDHQDGANYVATTPCTAVTPSIHTVTKLYRQGSSKAYKAPVANGNRQTVSDVAKSKKEESLSSLKGHKKKSSTYVCSPVSSNQGLQRKVFLKSANTGVPKILRSPGGRVKVQKEKGSSPRKAKEIVSTAKQILTAKLSNTLKKNTASSAKLTQPSKSYKQVSEKKHGASTVSASGSKERNRVVKDHSRNKIHHLPLEDTVRNQELPNSEGCYMIEKTEKPNTFRIFRQSSISSDTVSSTVSSPIARSVGQPASCGEKVNNVVDVVKNDDKWGPYLTKDQSKVCANRLKKRKSPSKEWSPKKKCFNNRLSVENINSNHVGVVNNAAIVPAEAGSSKQTSSYDANISYTNPTILLIDDKNCDIDKSKKSACTSSNSTIPSAAGVSNYQHEKSKACDTFTPSSDKTVVTEPDAVRPKDIYSIYRNISQGGKSSRSVITFPLSEQRLHKFLQETRGHTNPKKLALKVLQDNRTPGALKELIVQLYDYFKLCNDPKKQLRVSRLIMLLDNRKK